MIYLFFSPELFSRQTQGACFLCRFWGFVGLLGFCVLWVFWVFTNSLVLQSRWPRIFLIFPLSFPGSGKKWYKTNTSSPAGTVLSGSHAFDKFSSPASHPSPEKQEFPHQSMRMFPAPPSPSIFFRGGLERTFPFLLFLLKPLALHFSSFGSHHPFLPRVDEKFEFLRKVPDAILSTPHSRKARTCPPPFSFYRVQGRFHLHSHPVPSRSR